MTKFKFGDWVRHPYYGIGHVAFAFYDESLTIYFNKTGEYELLDLERNKDDIEALKKIIPKFNNFEDLFEEDEND